MLLPLEELEILRGSSRFPNYALAPHPSDPRVVVDTIRAIVELSDRTYRMVVVHRMLEDLWDRIPKEIREAVTGAFPRSRTTWAALADALGATLGPGANEHESVDAPLVSDGDERSAQPARGMLGISDLAHHFNLTPRDAEALRKRLERWRPAHRNGEWIELPRSDRRPRSAHYLYDPAAVETMVRDMKRRRLLNRRQRTKTSGEAPASDL